MPSPYIKGGLPQGPSVWWHRGSHYGVCACMHACAGGGKSKQGSAASHKKGGGGGHSGGGAAQKKAPPPEPPQDHFYFYPKMDPNVRAGAGTANSTEAGRGRG